MPRRLTSKKKKSSEAHSRGKIALTLIFSLTFTILIRLFYWQVIKGRNLQTQAQEQIIKKQNLTGERGKIFTSDDHLLVGNQTCYQVYFEKKSDQNLNEFLEQTDFTDILTKLLTQKKPELIFEDNSENQAQFLKNYQTRLENSLRQSDKNWILLERKVYQETKQAIEEELEKKWLEHLHFIPFNSRYYPEASMAAHLVGFVGKNEQGADTGYFGIEGALNKELTGQSKKIQFQTDALGFKLADQLLNQQVSDGRDVTLTIRRDVQFLLETKLKQGLTKYQAKKGEIIVLEPSTGKILGLATHPHYHPQYYYYYQDQDFKNPSLADLYEPGSTFKVLTVAAGLDAEVISPDTQCTKCSGPRVIANYTIRTWDDQYYPQIDMSEALAKSDNTAMIFVAERLTADKFSNYLKKFGLGQKINLDLQEDTDTPFPQKWGPVELATTAFGQGISLNSLQLVRAVSAIANQGVMMKPSIIEQVFDPQTQETIKYEPIKENQVISQETALKVTKMMVKAAQKGEAQWIGKNYLMAGKTGTSQIPNPQGGYLEDATIASFIGFAPPSDPKFVMLVKLVEPQTSPWAAETAAPLWFDVAEDLYLLL